MNPIIQNHQTKIAEICQEHFVQSLYAFGSVNTENFSPDSDIDLIVSFQMHRIPEEEYADLYFSMQFQLEDLLQRDIDLITERSIRNPYFHQEVSKEKQLVYQA